MKKTYIIPETEVLTVRTEAICTGSPLGLQSNEATSNTVLTKEQNDWDIWGEEE
jgi:hypothetical protein